MATFTGSRNILNSAVERDHALRGRGPSTSAVIDVMPVCSRSLERPRTACHGRCSGEDVLGMAIQVLEARSKRVLVLCVGVCQCSDLNVAQVHGDAEHHGHEGAPRRECEFRRCQSGGRRGLAHVFSGAAVLSNSPVHPLCWGPQRPKQWMPLADWSPFSQCCRRLVASGTDPHLAQSGTMTDN